MTPPSATDTDKRLLRVLRRQPVDRIPFWFMRQAGRYLPEYRAVRERVGGFLELCYEPARAAEVTLQPVRRFGMDAAILFSDILVVPDGLGQVVEFREGEGPWLEPLDGPSGVSALRLERLQGHLQPVYETVARVRSDLPKDVALIGFAGAPWTVASYMVEGGSTRDFAAVKLWAYRDPGSFQTLIDILVEATVEHLTAQIEAGAEAVQLFDSWAGVLPSAAFERWCTRPLAAIVAALRQRCAGTPIIVFPRGAGAMYQQVAANVGADAIGIDTTVPTEWAAATLQSGAALQGNLDPVMLVAGGKAMLAEADRIRRTLGGGPFIFNLGHGVLPETPPDHVAALSDFLRDGVA